MNLDDFAFEFGQALQKAGWMIATAESCTGGLVARSLTERSGSSAWFERGVVTYSNQAKQDLLGVSHEILQKYGAVSDECARAMASGLLARVPFNVAQGFVVLSVTGIAGPTGAVPGKPVGTVCFGFGLRTQQGVERIESSTQYFSGNREEVRAAAARYALEKARTLFDNLQQDSATSLA